MGVFKGLKPDEEKLERMAAALGWLNDDLK